MRKRVYFLLLLFVTASGSFARSSLLMSNQRTGSFSSGFIQPEHRAFANAVRTISGLNGYIKAKLNS